MRASRDISRLLEIMAALRTPSTGCPWDLEQDFASIAPYTIEEAYEVADAIQRHDLEDLRDELGDLLLQVVFHAEMAREAGTFDFGDVVESITAKLVRRHPHVFGDAEARTSARVRERWDEIKRDQEEREGIFHHVPENLPSLLFARKVQRRAAAVGFEYPDTEGALADLEDELRELREALAEAGERPPETEPDAHVFEELGDVLFATVNVARRLNVDPELALRLMSERFVARVERAERLAEQEGAVFAKLPLDEQDRYFDEAKEQFG
jgi:ATP diphosphatase